MPKVQESPRQTIRKAEAGFSSGNSASRKPSEFSAISQTGFPLSELGRDGRNRRRMAVRSVSEPTGLNKSTYPRRRLGRFFQIRSVSGAKMELSSSQGGTGP